MNQSSLSLMLQQIMTDLGINHLYDSAKIISGPDENTASNYIQVHLSAKPIGTYVQISPRELMMHHGANRKHDINYTHDIILNQLQSMIMKPLENSPYMARKGLTLASKDNKIKELEQQILMLKSDIKSLRNEMDTEKEHEPIISSQQNNKQS